MNEFHFFFKTFLKLNNFKIFEMEMNESRSVCFFARMPEVFSLLHVEQRNGKLQSGEETLVRQFALSFFALIFHRPKRAKNFWNPGKPETLHFRSI